jgi:hypothetical protein
MRLRATHIAGLFLLLASLGAAEGAPARSGGYRFGGPYIGVILAQESLGTSIPSRLLQQADEEVALNIPSISATHYRATWTMRPPAAQSSSLHAVTGSGL